VSDKDPETTPDYDTLYDSIFNLAVKSCSDYTGVAVASTMMGIAMRLYRTSLTDDDFTTIMSRVLLSVDQVRPFTSKDFGTPTLH